MSDDIKTPVVPEEQLSIIKNSLIRQAIHTYKAFIAELRKIPASQFQRQQAFVNFDQGMLWMKEAIASVNLEVKKVDQNKTPEPVSHTDTSDDAEPKTVDELEASNPPAPDTQF